MSTFFTKKNNLGRSEQLAKIPPCRKFVPDLYIDGSDNASIKSELLNSLRIATNGTPFAYGTKVGASNTKVRPSYVR